jgi:hypothetical protein
MPLVQDILGTGVFGPAARQWARGQKRNGSQPDSARQPQQDDEYGDVPGSGTVPGSGMDDSILNTGRRKRNSGKRS